MLGGFADQRHLLESISAARFFEYHPYFFRTEENLSLTAAFRIKVNSVQRGSRFFSRAIYNGLIVFPIHPGNMPAKIIDGQIFGLSSLNRDDVGLADIVIFSLQRSCVCQMGAIRTEDEIADFAFIMGQLRDRFVL